MSEYTIGWVGDEPRTFKGTNSWAIAGKDENGVEFKKTKLEIPEADGKPLVGATVPGELVPHPKLDAPMKLLVTATNGNTPSDATGSPQSDRTSVRGESTKDEDVARAGAYNNAISIVAAEMQAGKEYDATQVLARVELFAKKFLPSRQTYFTDADPKAADEDPLF